MLKLKVIQGLTPETFNLKEGINTIGRSPQSDIVLNSSGVSKNHAQMILKDGLCSITDLNSSNGTFVNGSKIQDRILKIGDRIAFHTVLMELQSVDIPKSIPSVSMGSAALHLAPTSQPANEEPVKTPQNLADLAQFYLENIILPGVYKINETYSTKTIVGALIAGFALIVALLSTIPMNSLMKDSIQKEAQRRALTIARQLASSAEKSLALGGDATIRTDLAEAEEGVTSAMVLSQEDGHIIAPLSKSMSYSNEEFAARARKHQETFIDQISSTTLGASVPIKTYSPESGQQTITAYAIVLYKMNTLDWGTTAGLFARILILSFVVAALIYFFIYKIVAEPIQQATKELDGALRGETDSISTKYNFEVFNSLVHNINSAISRMSHSQEEQKPIYDRSLEASNISRILSDASMALDSFGKIVSVNAAFEDLVGMRLLTLQNQNLEILQDQALKLNIEDLFAKSIQNPQQIQSAQLDISGAPFDLDAQAISDGSHVFYILVTLKKKALP